MLDILRAVGTKNNTLTMTIRKNISAMIKLAVILSFVAPFSILYVLEPIFFERTWIGRTFYLFFLWLVILEIILSWEELRKSRLERLRSTRTFSFIAALLLPTFYVIVANFLGLNAIITSLAKQNNMAEHYAGLMPLPIEYLVFATLFALMILLAYGTSGLKEFSTSVFFLGIIGVLYTIDNLFPYGKFTPFQLIVPATTTLAANVLSLMGYHTAMFFRTTPEYGSMPYLTAANSQGQAWTFGIAWPCSGVESLLIYTVVIVLFLKKSAIPLTHKIVYFAIGAAVTYFINILRIATIFVIAINNGDWQIFHDYYGLLYSVSWIISYPMIIVGSQALSGRIRNWRIARKNLILTS
jgi:thaumarchaeosortase